jgi:glutathionyl-hydroquinone reductase
MKLLEFFGRSLNPKQSSDKEDDKFSKDDLFWFLIDNDQLYKKHFLPIARKIKNESKVSKEIITKEFLPMVNQGCLEFIKKEKIFGKPSKLFPKDLREEMCEKLYDHYYEDVVKGKYRLG